MIYKTLLTHARSLIDTPDKWCREVYARKADGTVCCYTSKTATSFCLLGAVERAASDLGVADEHARRATDLLADATRTFSTKTTERIALSLFNDKLAHDKVLALFDRAIDTAPNATRP